MNKSDGKPVVVVDGKRVGGVQESQQAAEQEAARLRKLNESSGSDSPKKVTVKTQLNG